MQKIEVWPRKQMVYTQPRISPREWNAQNSQGSWDTNGSPNLGQMTRPCNNQQQQLKKGTCRIMNFNIPADHRVKLKENEKKDKYYETWNWRWYQL